MTPVLDSLVALRARAHASVGWYRAAQPVSGQEYASLSDKAREGCKWQPDPALVKALVAAEREHTHAVAVAALASGRQMATSPTLHLVQGGNL